MLEKVVTIFYANWMIFEEVIGLKVQITENSDTEKCKYADVSKKIVGMELIAVFKELYNSFQMSGHGSSRNTRFKICDRKCIFNKYLMTSPALLGKMLTSAKIIESQ